jgi:replicative DNA helicase
LLFHRNRENEEQDKAQGKTEFDASLFIEKNKEGWTGEIDLIFKAEQMTFVEKSAEIFTMLPENNSYNEPNPF